MKPQYRSYLLFLSIFIFGSFFVGDYGISWDENWHRHRGKEVIAFIAKKIHINRLLNIPENLGDLSGHIGGYGAFFDVLCGVIEEFFLNDEREVFLMRHFVNFSIYFLGVYMFFLLLKEFFNSQKYAFIGSMFYFLHPRLIAHGFFNMKDSLAQSFVVIALFPIYLIYKNKDYRDCIIAGLLCGLAITTRLPVIFLPVLFIFLLIFQVFIEKKNILSPNFLKRIMTFIIFTILGTYVFWPMLWEAPLLNFKTNFYNMKNYISPATNYFLGSYLAAKNLPWYYIPSWIFFTTPITFLVTFFIGTLKIIKNIVYERNSENLFNSFMLLGFFLPVIVIIYLESTLYGGWRHMFFIYPFMSFIMITGFKYLLDFISLKLNTSRYYLKIIISIMVFIEPVYSIIKFHPVQQVYFNSFAGIDPMKNFEGDYWGVSNKVGLEWIVNNDKREFIRVVYNQGMAPVSMNRHMLKKEDRGRLKFIAKKEGMILKEIEADYYITNFYNDASEYLKMKAGNTFPYNKCVYSLDINQMSILSIYDISHD